MWTDRRLTGQLGTDALVIQRYTLNPHIIAATERETESTGNGLSIRVPHRTRAATASVLLLPRAPTSHCYVILYLGLLFCFVLM